MIFNTNVNIFFMESYIVEVNIVSKLGYRIPFRFNMKEIDIERKFVRRLYIFGQRIHLYKVFFKYSFAYEIYLKSVPF